MSKKVTLQSGYLMEENNSEVLPDAPTPNKLERDVMLVYAGKFLSMDGEVEIKDEDIQKLSDNHNSILSKVGRLASGDVHVKNYPPLQLDHSTSAKDTIGRLIGDVTVGEHTLADGSKAKALLGKVRVLGKENVEKVMDGRWTHVSIGADLGEHKISELTITPFPAAAEASLLSKKRVNLAKVDYKNYVIDVSFSTYDQRWYWEACNHQGHGTSEADATKAAKEAVDTYIAEEKKTNPKLSSENQEGEDMSYKSMKEKMSLYEKCKKHLTEVEKKTEEEADKHLEGMKDEEVSKMAADHDEHEKKLAIETDEAKANMAAKTVGLVKLAKDFSSMRKSVELTAKKARNAARFSKLKSEAKVTPAELKKIDMTALASKDDVAIEAVFDSYEKREPLVHVGLVGSVKALTGAQLHGQLSKIKMSREELLTRLNMPGKREEALKKLKELSLEEQQALNAVPSETQQVDMANFEAAYGHMKKLMDEGKHDEAKEHMRKHMEALKPGEQHAEVGADAEKQMSELAEEVKKMQTGFDEFIKLAGPALGINSNELV